MAAVQQPATAHALHETDVLRMTDDDDDDVEALDEFMESREGEPVEDSGCTQSAESEDDEAELEDSVVEDMRTTAGAKWSTAVAMQNCVTPIHLATQSICGATGWIIL